jgi:flagellar motor protein MotB
VNTRADAWCSINPTSGEAGDAKITVTTKANDTPDDRTASIIIKAGTASKTIAVSQKQKNALTVTASKFEIGAEGGEVAIEVKANIDFEYAIEESAKEWITYQTTRAMKTSTLVFKVAKNDDLEKREGKIAIKSDEFNEVITIYQAGAEPTIVISKNEYIVSSDSETIAVDVTSNVDVAVEIPSDVDWIIRVDGHTDNKQVISGTRGYRNNTQLSLLRASAVVEELTKDGVSKLRLIPTGFGDMYPIATGTDKASLQKNRRIELQLTNR